MINRKGNLIIASKKRSATYSFILSNKKAFLMDVYWRTRFKEDRYKIVEYRVNKYKPKYPIFSNEVNSYCRNHIRKIYKLL